MKISPTTWLYPPRPTTAIHINDAIPLYTDLNWTAQLKYNDTRLLIKLLPNGNIELWNRHAEQLRNYHGAAIQKTQSYWRFRNVIFYVVIVIGNTTHQFPTNSNNVSQPTRNRHLHPLAR